MRSACRWRHLAEAFGFAAGALLLLAVDGHPAWVFGVPLIAAILWWQPTPDSTQRS